MRRILPAVMAAALLGGFLAPPAADGSPTDGAFVVTADGGPEWVRTTATTPMRLEGGADGAVTFWFGTSEIDYLTFRPPAGQRLQPGRYDDVVGLDDEPFLPPVAGRAGIGEAGFCRNLRGGFVITRLDWDPPRQPTRLEATYETRCYGWASASRGAIRFGAPGVPAAPPVMRDAPAAFRTTHEVGWVNGGERYDARFPQQSMILNAYRDHVYLVSADPFGSARWEILLVAPHGETLRRGQYRDALAIDHSWERGHVGRPGIRLYASSGWCPAPGGAHGAFTIRRYSWDAAGLPGVLDASFELSCPGASGTLRGELRFGVADGPPGPDPEPATELPTESDHAAAPPSDLHLPTHTTDRAGDVASSALTPSTEPQPTATFAAARDVVLRVAGLTRSTARSGAVLAP